MKYLVTMEPVGPFFFGEDAISEFGNSSPYFQRSRHYPQQTAILGLLRYLLLVNNDKLNIPGFSSDPAVADLIGPTGFPSKEGYGLIKNISSVYILHEEASSVDALFMAPHYHEMTYTTFVGKTGYGSKKVVDTIAELKGYDAKKPVKTYLLGKQGVVPLDFDEKEGKGIFRHYEVSGNQKRALVYAQGGKADILNSDAKKKARQDGYYKQKVSCFAKPGYKFACYAQISDDSLQDRTFTVPFGGDRHPFIVKFQSAANPPFEPDFSALGYTAAETAPCKLVLLSDTYVSEQVLDYSDFGITNSITFRNIRSAANKTRYYAKVNTRGAVDGALSFSGRQNLLTAGSVLFIPDSSALENVRKLLDQSPFYTNIGFNSYKLYNL